MATNNNLDAAERSCKTETLEEVLTRIQRMRVRDEFHEYLLMGDDWDWLVVLQCLQANGYFLTQGQRPPFKPFVRWLEEHGIPHYCAQYDPRKLSNAYLKLNGATHPWTGVDLSKHMLLRWRDLYYNLDKLLKALPTHTDV